MRVIGNVNIESIMKMMFNENHLIDITYIIKINKILKEHKFPSRRRNIFNIKIFLENITKEELVEIYIKIKDINV